MGLYLVSHKAGKEVFVEHEELEAQIIQAVGQLMEVNTKEAIGMMAEAEMKLLKAEYPGLAFKYKSGTNWGYEVDFKRSRI